MRKESLFAGLLALLLMFVFLGCEQANSGTKPGSGLGTGADPNDKWTEVTSLDDLEGRWIAKGFTTDVDGSPVTLTMSIEFPIGFGDVEVCMWDSTPVRVSENDFITGEWAKQLGFDNGTTYVNRTKTALKIVAPKDMTADVPSDEAWKEGQEFYSTLTGDMEMSFSAGAPYIMTYTAILHKTSESTEPNPGDTWTEVTSLGGLEGTWKSRYKMTTTVLTDPNAAITVLEEYTYPVSNGNIKDGVEKIYIRDYTDIIKKVASAGLSEKVAWDSIKSGLGDSYEFSEVAPYTAKRTEYIAREDFEGEYIDDNSSISVNQNKTRMKVTDKWRRLGIQDDAEWEDFKARQPVYSGDMSVVYAKESVEDDTIPYTYTYITILHKQ